MSNRAFDEDDGDSGFGTLAGGGADQLDRVTTKVAPEGLVTTCFCGRCGHKNAIGISWQEAVMGSMGLVPPDWDVDQRTGTLFPRVGCAAGGCNYLIKIGYAPQEFDRSVRSGVEANLISAQNVDGYKAQLRAARGGR